MDRREFIEGLAVTAPLATLGAVACEEKRAPAPAAEPPRLPSWVPSYFAVEQARALEAAAERLLPETDTPGATSAAVGPFIESVVSDVYDADAQRAFLAGLDQLNERARKAHGKSFADCPASAQVELLAELSREAKPLRQPWQPGQPSSPPPFIDTLRSAAIVALCYSRLGATRVLAYEPVPGPYQGCVPAESVGRSWFDG